MRVVEIKNITNASITVKHSNGVDSIVPPGSGLFDVDVVNTDELVGKSIIIQDLSEVKENNARRTLND